MMLKNIKTDITEFSDSPKRLCKTVNETNDENYVNNLPNGFMQQKLFRLYNVSIQLSLYCHFRIANFNSEFKEEIMEYFKHRLDELFKYQKLFVTIF